MKIVEVSVMNDPRGLIEQPVLNVPQLPFTVPRFEIGAVIQFKEHEWPLLYDVDIRLIGPEFSGQLLHQHLPLRPSQAHPYTDGRAVLTAHAHIVFRHEGSHALTVAVDQTKSSMAMFQVRLESAAYQEESR